ncbi:hypothetical protein [Chryseobacterium sp. Mn2064]|uniref:hypothetical protein n=1 Tax=Chryseobacterium sp. Mn2064 TaxID=3395263 RepID=UPI003BD16CB6
MDDFEKIKEIWLSERNVLLPDSEEIKSSVKRYKSSKKRNMYLLAAAAVLIWVIIICVIVFGKADHYTRIIGEVFIFLGISIMVFIKIRSLNKVNTTEFATNQDFLNHLKKSTLKESKVNGFQMSAFVLMGGGYAFYIYKDVSDNDLLMIFSYSALIIFLLLMYFVFRPFAERASKKKIKRLLDNIDMINSQI